MGQVKQEIWALQKLYEQATSNKPVLRPYSLLFFLIQNNNESDDASLQSIATQLIISLCDRDALEQIMGSNTRGTGGNNLACHDSRLPFLQSHVGI